MSGGVIVGVRSYDSSVGAWVPASIFNGYVSVRLLLDEDLMR
jgi:hypothetical protein